MINRTEKKLFNELEAKFKKISSYLLNYKMAPSELEDKVFIKHIKDLEFLVLDRRYDKIINQVNLIPGFNKTKLELRKIDAVYEIFLEVRAVIDFMIKNISFENNSHLTRDYKTAIIEGENAGFDVYSKIVFVGSGPFPSTAISYMQYFKSSIKCIDMNPEAVMLAEKLINKLGFQDKITNVLADGSNFNYQDCTHIVLSAMSWPKNKILARISQTAKKDVRIVVRTTTGLSSIFYAPLPLNDKIMENFVIEDNIIDKKNTFNSLVLKFK